MILNTDEPFELWMSILINVACSFPGKSGETERKKYVKKLESITEVLKGYVCDDSSLRSK